MPYPYQSVIDTAVLPQLCGLAPRLLSMNGLFRVWMTYHFGDSSRIIDDILKEKLWHADPKETRISIEPHSAYKTDLTEKRPAIIIKRQGWQRIRIGINNMRMGEISLDGAEYYVNLWQGSHTLFCISGVPAEVERLATEVFEDLNRFAPAVRRKMDLIRLEVAEAGEYGKLEESGKNYVVPINVGYVLADTWTLRQEAPFLKSLDLSLMFPE
jgi:hypothetical protein